MEDMDETTTAPPPDAAFDASRLRTVLELRRPVDDRIVAGVCTGLARYLRLDPVVVRVLLATLSVVGGLGLIAYGTVWLLTPQEGSDRAPLGHVDALHRGGTRTVVLLLAAVLAVTAIVGPGVLWWGPWPGLVVVGVVAWLLIRDRDPGRGPDGNEVAPREPTADAAVVPAGQTPAATSRLPTGGSTVGAPPVSPPPGPTSRAARRDGGRLTVLALGLVGLVLAGAWFADRAGEPVDAPVVVAVALGVVGSALLVGTLLGNGRPLVIPALLLGGALAVTSVIPSWTVGERRVAPVSSGAVEHAYELGVGRQLIDLGGVTDVDALDGRVVRVETGVGETVVVAPTGTDLTIDADVGAGELDILGSRIDHGPGTGMLYADPDTAAPDLELVLRNRLGRIEVERG
jgi:phage shock protein PspC (stress-responsive transcriptional regulator)